MSAPFQILHTLRKGRSMFVFDPAAWLLIPAIVLFWLVSGCVSWHIHVYLEMRQPRFDRSLCSIDDHQLKVLFVCFYGTFFLWLIWPGKLFAFAALQTMGLSRKPLIEWFGEGF